MNNYKIGDYVRCVDAECGTAYSIKLIRNAIYQISCISPTAVGLVGSKASDVATWDSCRFIPWVPRAGDRVKSEFSQEFTLTESQQILLRDSNCETDGHGLIPILGVALELQAKSDDVIRPGDTVELLEWGAPKCTGERVVVTQIRGDWFEFGSYQWPIQYARKVQPIASALPIDPMGILTSDKPYNIDAAWIHDRMTASKRLDPPTTWDEAQCRLVGIQKPQTSFEVAANKADLSGNLYRVQQIDAIRHRLKVAEECVAEIDELKKKLAKLKGEM